jgi:hypothetical protein
MMTTSVTPISDTRPRARPEPLTWADLQVRLANLADLLDTLGEPADRGLTDDLWVAPGTFANLAATVRDLAEQCEANAGAPEDAGR